MNVTPLDHVLDVVVQPYVSPALIAPGRMAAIQTLARRLPSTLTTFFGFECRLADETAAADLLLSAAPPWGRKVLADLGGSLPEGWREQPVWRRIQAFAHQWADPASVLHDAVKNVWLEFDLAEFDLAETVPARTVPSVFFGPQPLRARTPHDWVTATAIPLLSGAPLSAASEQRLSQCMTALPGDAYVFQIGLMLARHADAVRLCIRELPAADLAGYLERIGWPGDMTGFAPLAATLAGLADRVDVDLDVGDTVRPKLGLECYFQGGPDGRAKLTRFLDHLAARGWCSAAKRDALLDYAGYVQERADPERWPRHLWQVSQLLGPATVSMFVRFVHHVKVVHHPEGHVEAKAYLAVHHVWCPRETLRRLQHAVPTTV